MATIAPRFAGIQQFEQCLNGARMTPFGFDSNGDLAVDSENDAVAVAAIQGALNDLQYGLSVTGNFDGATESAVRQFKSDQMLAVPAGLAAHDGVVGPGTSGRLNELFTPPPVPSVPVTPTPPPPALDAWNHLVSFRPPAAMQASLNARFGLGGTPARVVHAIEDARGPISLDHYPVRVEALPSDGSTTMTAEQLLELVRRNLNLFVDGSPDGCSFDPADPAIDTAAWLPPFLPTASPGAVISIDMYASGINVDDGSVVLSEVSTDHWIFSTIWTPEDGGHPVSGNREFGFAPSSAEEVIFYTRGADRTTSVADALGEATVFGAAHQLWLSFQRRLAAYVNSNGGRATAEQASATRYDWPTVKAQYHQPTESWNP